MANSGKDTNGSQFFITYDILPNLNGGYTIFGEVISRMDNVNKITLRDPATNRSSAQGHQDPERGNSGAMIQPGRGTDWHTPSMLQALLAGVVLALNPVFAAILIFIQLNNPSWMSASVKPYALSSMAVILLTLAICAAPSLFHSLRRVAGHPALKSDGARDFLLASLSLILGLLALGLRLITEPPGLAGGVIQPLAVILAAVPLPLDNGFPPPQPAGPLASASLGHGHVFVVPHHPAWSFWWKRWRWSC